MKEQDNVDKEIENVSDFIGVTCTCRIMWAFLLNLLALSVLCAQKCHQVMEKYEFTFSYEQAGILPIEVREAKRNKKVFLTRVKIAKKEIILSHSIQIFHT